MYKEYVHRVPGGKTIRVCADVEEGVIKRASITGDFFAEPDWVIDELSMALKGIRPHEIEDIVKKHLEKPGVRIYGARPKDFAEAIKGIFK